MNIEELATFCKSKGFVYSAAEIYGGLSGFFDFGPLGVALKNNIKQSWWKFYVDNREDVVGQDGSIITNPRVWEASGHVDNFSDPILTCSKCKHKVRADNFIEDELKINADGFSTDQINEHVDKHDLKCPSCQGDFNKVEDFKLMFQTKVGASAEKSAEAFLRPETAQSIFPNFRIIADTCRMQLPFGVAQIGKAFRNEISPRDFLFRCREFEQMELEFFIHPDEADCKLLTEEQKNISINVWTSEQQDKGEEHSTLTLGDLLAQKKADPWHVYWLAQTQIWLTQKIGLKAQNLRLREHVPTELSHYSSATLDFDYKFPHGFKELHGCANRGQYDVSQHQKVSGKKMELHDEATSKKVIPRVIEPSQGVDRLFLAAIVDSLEDDKERGNKVLKVSPLIAPIKIAVLPLVKKDGLNELAREVFDSIKEDLVSQFDSSGSVGRRYARADELGIPFCITVDYDSKEDNTVTIRDRDSTEQKRIKIADLPQTVQKLINGKTSFINL